MSDVAREVRRSSDVRVLWPWYAIEFLNSYACTIVLACVPYFIKNGPIGGTVGDSLWQSAAWGLLYVPYALLAGKLADAWGARTLLVRAAVLQVPTVAAGVAAVWWPGLWMLLAVMAVFNLCSTAHWPALESAVSRSPVRVRLGDRMSVYNLTWSGGGFLAFVTADLVMGPAGERHWEAVFLVPAAACAVAAALAVFATIPQSMLSSDHASDRHDSAEDVEADVERAAAHVSVQRARALLLMAWAGNTLAYVANNTLIAVMPRISVDYAALGSIWTFARFAGFLAWFGWAGWHYKTRYLVGAYALMIVSFVAMLVGADPVKGTPLAILLPGQVGFGLALSFIYASSLYYAMHVSSGGGSHAGVHEALIGLGICVGCSAGALTVTGGVPSLMPIALAVGGILVAGGGVMAWVGRRKAEG